MMGLNRALGCHAHQLFAVRLFREYKKADTRPDLVNQTFLVHTDCGTKPGIAFACDVKTLFGRNRGQESLRGFVTL